MSVNRHDHDKDWLYDIMEEIYQKEKESREVPLHAAVDRLRELIISDASLRMLSSSMFNEIPCTEDPTGNPQVTDLDTMLKLINHILTRAPSWSDQAYQVGHVALPLNTILNWPMATPSGRAFFLHPQINSHFKEILNAWKSFLESSESVHVLNRCDWLSPYALKQLARDANVVAGRSYSFEEIYVCDPEDSHYGWTSWDDFFVRRFREGIRPVAFPDPPLQNYTMRTVRSGTRNSRAVVVSACESKPFALKSQIKDSDKFWLKGQPYSLSDMFAGGSLEHLAPSFIGGTIYQAFLSSTTYHRWHAPVSGIIRGFTVIPGTYFSSPALTGFSGPDGPDPSAPDRSQGYLTHVATRAIIAIEADSPDIGLMCFMAIGMVEISSCEIDHQIATGAKRYIAKGEELGMFHFGGSTYCLLFQNKTQLAWINDAIPRDKENHGKSENLALNSALAYVIPEALRDSNCTHCKGIPAGFAQQQ